MNTDELNTALVMEITHYRTTDEITPDLKRLLMELIWIETKKKRYAHVSDNVKILCESEAYVAACKHCIHFDPKKSDKPNLYMGQIIWCSYINTIKKHCITNIINKTERL